MLSGSKSSGHDSIERSRRGVPVCRSRLAIDRIAESRYASASLQLSLPRAKACGHRWLSRLHSQRMENAPKLTQNFSAQCKFID